nr:helix-turn-helix transcriptional regulator [Actibacterium sp. 188UL27-1]
MSINVHKNLEAFRKRRKFKKSEMAKMMGVSARSYYMYETGKRPIPSSALGHADEMGSHCVAGMR